MPTNLTKKIREIRQATKGKMLNNEELLVLACLDLYDQVQFLTNDIQLRTQTTTQAAALPNSQPYWFYDDSALVAYNLVNWQNIGRALNGVA